MIGRPREALEPVAIEGWRASVRRPPRVGAFMLLNVVVTTLTVLTEHALGIG